MSRNYRGMSICRVKPHPNQVIIVFNTRVLTQNQRLKHTQSFNIIILFLSNNETIAALLQHI